MARVRTRKAGISQVRPRPGPPQAALRADAAQCLPRSRRAARAPASRARLLTRAARAGRREPQVGPPPPPPPPRAPRRLLSLEAALSCAVAAPAQPRRAGCPEA